MHDFHQFFELARRRLATKQRERANDTSPSSVACVVEEREEEARNRDKRWVLQAEAPHLQSADRHTSGGGACSTDQMLAAVAVGAGPGPPSGCKGDANSGTVPVAGMTGLEFYESMIRDATSAPPVIEDCD